MKERPHPVRQPNDIEHLMSGSRKGPAATMLRAALRAAEPFYAAIASTRNYLFDTHIRPSHTVPRPVISIGNITTGGTGKTPMVRWLASRLRDEGRRVAILSRGYKSAPGAMGDEQLMLDRVLNASGQIPVILKANPRRAEAARKILRDHPETDVFILDDGFQHRAIARDLDIVLLNAAEPFGFGHILPRGLLREPMSGLKRAGAFVITHADCVDSYAIAEFERMVRRYNSTAPIYRSIHACIGLRTACVEAGDAPDRALDDLRSRKFFAFCGIGSPDRFDSQLRSLGESYLGRRWFADHHRYGPDDLTDVRARAQERGAEILVTTEKDWVKLANLSEARDSALPIWRLDIAMQFANGDEARLMEQVRGALRNGEVKTGC